MSIFHHHHHSDHGHGDEHGHGHSHAHHHAPPQDYHIAFVIAVVLNLSYVIVQGTYAIFANSMSLLADAGHNLGDVLGLMLAWGANYLLSKGASARYSYGHKKTTIMAALVNSLILVATSLIIIQESIKHLMYQRQVDEVIVIYVALIGIFINGGTALLFMRGRKDDLNIKAAFWHLAMDSLISAGVVVTGIAILWTGKEWLDPLAGLLIVVTILGGTWGLLRDTVNLLLDAVPRGIDQAAVKEYILSIPGVVGVHDMHIWGLSTREVAMTAHVVMDDAHIDDVQLKTINDTLHNKYLIQHVTLQVERGDLCDPCGQTNSCH